MIRGFFLILGLMVGLTLALVLEAQMSHLRSLARMIGAPIWQWSEHVTDGSKFAQGELINAVPLLWPDVGGNGEETDLQWQFARVSPKGMSYQVTLTTGQNRETHALLLPFSATRATWLAWLEKTHP